MIFQKYKARNVDMPVALILGADPIFALASESSIPYEQNEFEYAGAILGRHYEVAKCKTLDLYVPAKAEMVLEGHVSISQTELEGPMGEITQTYGGKSEKPTVKIDLMSYRQNPISQNIISGTIEEHSVVGIPLEGHILARLREVSPRVISVNILPFMFNCIIKIDDYPESEAGIAKNILACALTDMNIKTAVIVNRDIDIYNPHDVNWALATRVDFNRDMMITNDMMGFPLDPMKPTKSSPVTKIGIDATVNPMQRDKFERRWVRGYDAINLSDWIG